MADESKMPPRCCTQPIPSAIVQSILSRDEQQTFIPSSDAVQRPSWETRIFCPTPRATSLFPAEQDRPEASLPGGVQALPDASLRHVQETCPSARQDCPGGLGAGCSAEDGREVWLEAMLQVPHAGGACPRVHPHDLPLQGAILLHLRWRLGFRRGLPEFCNGEEELERRRREEGARLLELEAEEGSPEAGRGRRRSRGRRREADRGEQGMQSTEEAASIQSWKGSGPSRGRQSGSCGLGIRRRS